MPQTPHKDKLVAAIGNPKCNAQDVKLLKEALAKYEQWTQSLSNVRSTGKDRVFELTRLLNEYKDFLEVELLSKSQSSFLIRQKGQLKLDNSVIEEFLIRLVTNRFSKDCQISNCRLGHRRHSCPWLLLR